MIAFVFHPTIARALVARLRESDPAHLVFEAPIQEPDLIVWERAHGIELPVDYRTYLLELGNGGAGPFYGIWPLGLWDGAGARGSFDDAISDLSAPFPHREAWNLPADRLDPPDFEDDDEADAWQEALDADLYEPSLMNGAFWICDQGCALRTILVVSGPERGTVWADLRATGGGIVPHTGSDGHHLTFGDWYLTWLEQAMRETSQTR